MLLNADDAFLSHFKHLKQVFLYITDECNLQCVQCLYKPNLMLARSIEPTLAKKLIYTFREMGAFKLTLLGGEVSLYSKNQKWQPLFDLVQSAKDWDTHT